MKPINTFITEQMIDSNTAIAAQAAMNFFDFLRKKHITIGIYDVGGYGPGDPARGRIFDFYQRKKNVFRCETFPFREFWLKDGLKYAEDPDEKVSRMIMNEYIKIKDKIEFRIDPDPNLMNIYGTYGKILVCDRWMDEFMEFPEDLIHKYQI